MAIEVKHRFQSPKADGGDTTLIRPSNWNDTHIIEMTGPALIGRGTAGTGAAQELTLGTGLSISGTTLNAGTIAGRNLTISTAAPSGGVDGDVWFRY